MCLGTHTHTHAHTLNFILVFLLLNKNKLPETCQPVLGEVKQVSGQEHEQQANAYVKKQRTKPKLPVQVDNLQDD